MDHHILIHNKHLIKKVNIPSGTVHFGGYIQYRGRFYTAENLQDICSAPNFFLEHLTELRGEFAIALHTGDGIVAIADRKRSIPLFYGKEGDRWLITDKISGHNGKSYNETSVKEFILTGFTANDRTLYNDFYQVEAGSYVKITEGGSVEKEEYYQYYHHPENKTLEEFSLELKDLLYTVFEDLSKRIHGKTPILPLSGGYDSRIIALLLKEFGVKNIKSFTYGKQGNKESLVSKDIADKLGFEWTFIEYKKEKWEKWYQSKEWKSYVDFAVNGSSMAHLQDWPAVAQIVKENDDQYVFIPGHSGDFIAGSHLAYEITEDRKFSQDDVVDFILQKHHKLWDMGRGIKESGSDVVAEIKKSFGSLPYQSNEEASALFEYWDWKERQAKFIINSVRVYEYYQKDWEIPLWDDRLMDFFLKVPVSLRFKKYLYDYTLHLMYPDYFPKPARPAGKETSLKEKYGAFYHTAKKLYNKKKLYQQYYTEPMEWYGIYESYPKYLAELSFKQDRIKYTQPYNINSFLVKDYIKSLKGDA